MSVTLKKDKLQTPGQILYSKIPSSVIKTKNLTVSISDHILLALTPRKLNYTNPSYTCALFNFILLFTLKYGA